MCLCVAGRHTHSRHPTAICRMLLREMLVHCGTLLHEMVFLEVIIKYYFYSLWQQSGLFELLACFSVHCAFFWVLTPCSLVGGYKSLSYSINHTDVAEVSGFLDCFVLSTGKLLLNWVKVKALQCIRISVSCRYCPTYKQDTFWIAGCKLKWLKVGNMKWGGIYTLHQVKEIEIKSLYFAN